MDTGTVLENVDNALADNFQLSPPIDVYEIARNNGLEVIEREFPDSQSRISGFVTQSGGAGKLYVNLSDGPERRRFTVAHELGHWRLHKSELTNNPERSILFRISIGKLNTDPLEREANTFAANLLVPLEMLRALKDDTSAQDLADIFDVSSDVIGYRLELLAKKDTADKADGAATN